MCWCHWFQSDMMEHSICVRTLLSSSNNQPFEELYGWIKAQHNPSAKCDIFIHTTQTPKTIHKKTMTNPKDYENEMFVHFVWTRLSLVSSLLAIFNPLYSFRRKQQWPIQKYLSDTVLSCVDDGWKPICLPVDTVNMSRSVAVIMTAKWILGSKLGLQRKKKENRM